MSQEISPIMSDQEVIARLVAVAVVGLIYCVDQMAVYWVNARNLPGVRPQRRRATRERRATANRARTGRANKDIN